MRRNDDEEANQQHRINRRRALKSVGIAATGLVAPVGVSGAASEDSERVPAATSQGEVIEWVEVPRDWQAHLQHAKKANRSFKDEILQHEDIVGIGLEGAPELYGGKRGFQISVSVSPEFDGDLPTHYQGVPVESEVVTHLEQSNCPYNDSYEDPVPGGVTMEGDSGGVGTTCCKAKYNGNEYIMTAAHLFQDSDCSGVDLLDTAYQPYYSTKMGVLDAYDLDRDVALVNYSSYRSDAAAEIAGDSNNTYPIRGVASETGIASRVSDPYDSYRKMGKSTGETTGGLIKMDHSSGECNVDYNNNGDWWSRWPPSTT